MTGLIGRAAIFLDLRFELLDLPQAADLVLKMTNGDDFKYVVTPNVDHVVQYYGTSDLVVPQAYHRADLVLCDSWILGRLARLSDMRLPVVPGSDLTSYLLNQGHLSGLKVAVVGGDALLHRQLMSIYPCVEWCFFEPAMAVRSDPEARQQIRTFVEQTAADLCFFAFGAPQSEITCAEIAERGSARGVALCIGGSLHFLTGAKRRAPLWMRRAGLEWLHRLLTEPTRLWRRYLIDGPKIITIWWRWDRARRHLRAVSDSSLSGDL